MHVEIGNLCTDDRFVCVLHKTYAESVSWKGDKSITQPLMHGVNWVECTCDSVGAVVRPGFLGALRYRRMYINHKALFIRHDVVLDVSERVCIGEPRTGREAESSRNYDHAESLMRPTLPRPQESLRTSSIGI